MSQVKTSEEALLSFYKNLVSDFDNLAKAQQDFDKEKARWEATQEKIAKVHCAQSVKLDVGGYRFKTCAATLTREDGMLARMFAGKGVGGKKDQEGYYRIERSGWCFEYILEYLQTGTFVPPSSSQKLELLKKEVDFYQIDSLMKLLNRKTFKFSSINDQNGILYWLGTKKGSSAYQNPVNLKLVKTVGPTNPNAIVDALNSYGDGGGCHPWNNKEIIIQFVDISVIPSSYSLSFTPGYCKYSNNYGMGGYQYRPFNWKIEGWNNGKWKTLKVHSNEQGLVNQQRANWDISHEEPFSQFKITCTGLDSSQSFSCFHVSNFEVYGVVEEMK